MKMKIEEAMAAVYVLRAMSRARVTGYALVY